MLKKCNNCHIGTYWHSPSEEASLFEDLDMDGMNYHSRIFNFCPNCGHQVGERFKKWARDCIRRQREAIKNWKPPVP